MKEEIKYGIILIFIILVFILGFILIPEGKTRTLDGTFVILNLSPKRELILPTNYNCTILDSNNLNCFAYNDDLICEMKVYNNITDNTTSYSTHCTDNWFYH